MNIIEIETLITVVCEYFCENIQEIQNYHPSTKKDMILGNSIDWYNKRTDEQKRKISEKLLKIMKKDFKNHGPNSNSKCFTDKKM